MVLSVSNLLQGALPQVECHIDVLQGIAPWVCKSYHGVLSGSLCHRKVLPANGTAVAAGPKEEPRRCSSSSEDRGELPWSSWQLSQAAHPPSQAARPSPLPRSPLSHPILSWCRFTAVEYWFFQTFPLHDWVFHVDCFQLLVVFPFVLTNPHQRVATLSPFFSRWTLLI